MQIWKFFCFPCLCSYKDNTLNILHFLSIEFLSYLPLKFYLFLETRHYFIFFRFINKHFNTFLTFSLSISQKVKGAKMENLKTNISTDFSIYISFTFKIKINYGIFLSKRVFRQRSVCVLNVSLLLRHLKKGVMDDLL